VGSLALSQATSVAILPSALFYERFALGASWRTRCSRCCYLIIDLGSHRELGQDSSDGFAPGRCDVVSILSVYAGMIRGDRHRQEWLHYEEENRAAVEMTPALSVMGAAQRQVELVRRVASGPTEWRGDRPFRERGWSWPRQAWLAGSRTGQRNRYWRKDR
jgi:hypothetical protein